MIRTLLSLPNWLLDKWMALYPARLLISRLEGICIFKQDTVTKVPKLQQICQFCRDKCNVWLMSSYIKLKCIEIVRDFLALCVGADLFQHS